MSTYIGLGDQEGMRKTNFFEPRSNDQQTSTLDTEPQAPDKTLSPHSPIQYSQFHGQLHSLT